jgi:hypothetical protein
VTQERLVAESKHRFSRVSAEDGMQIDKSDEHPQNAQFSILDSFEPYSNAMNDSLTAA